MCQQQFEKEVSSELYQCIDKLRSFERMAETIAAHSLDFVRSNPASPLGEWVEGRASASALIHPTPETISAKNECRFLAGDYARRNRGLL